MTDHDALWQREAPASEYVDVPTWIDPDITSNTVAAIIQGGCASGAYMPAVTYHQALETMREHGNEVWDYLEQHDLLTVPDPKSQAMQSWGNLACHYLSMAVELWAASIAEELAEALEDAEEDEE